MGPNSDPEKATTIGEAAHIRGAKPGSTRFDANMSDPTRAEITNGIWLCRNCHVQIDRDGAQYPADLLFAWRKQHEDHVSNELGSRGDQIRHQIAMNNYNFLDGYPPIVQRLVIDQPVGWEWRLAAELLRHLNKPEFKRLKSLQAGQYFVPLPSIRIDEFPGWVTERVHVMSNLVGPLAKLLDRLSESWGEPGEPGDVEEMHDTCVLIHDMLGKIIDHEEVLRFSNLPEEGEEIRNLLADAIGRNVEGLAKLPEKLDEMVAMIDTDHGGTVEDPLIVNWTFPFDLPKDFNAKFDEALFQYQRLTSR